jgi:sugar phosphate permease
MKQRFTGTHFALTALMVALSAISYFDRTALSIAAPTVMKEFGFSEVSMGTVFSAFLLTYTLFMTPGGSIVDRFGARIVLTVAGLGAGLFTGLLSLCSTIALLSLALACCTSCEGPFWATAIHIGGAEVGAASGIMNTGGNLGGMLAPFFTPLIASRYGWTAALLFGCAMVLLSVVTFYLIDPESSFSVK